MNDHRCQIMFFVNPMKKEWPERDDSGVIYFRPGVHHPGIIRMTRWQVLFVDEGSVVHTSVITEKADNFRIIDNSEYRRITGDLSCNMPVMLYECENVNIAGVTFRDASCFTIIGYNLRNVPIENVKIVGNWRYNSDGIDLYNSQNVIIRDSFVRTYDDSIVIKAQKPYDTMNCENWLVSGCVVWNDWGHALEIGAETRADEYRNIRFSDCDVIHANGTPIDVQNNGDALCHDILFENIRVEYKTSAAPQQMQNTDESICKEAGKENVFPIPGVYIPSGCCHGFLCGDDGAYGRSRNITVRNIQAIMPEQFGSRVPPSVFGGHSETEDTRNVLIDGLYVNGRRVADREEANLIIGEFASEIEFR